MDDALIAAKMRSAFQRVIDSNPVPIAIHRVEIGVGEQDLPPFSGRMMDEDRVRLQRETAAGPVELTAWTLYAPHTADVKKTATITDTFTLPDGRRFEVIRVRPREWKGHRIGYLADCIEVT